MKRTGFRLRLCLTLLVMNLVFIWGNSAMSAQMSNTFSAWVADILRFLLPGDSGTAGGGHGLLRKLAHFSEFACLGALFCWLLGMLGRSGRYLPFLSLLCGVIAACADETIQVFSPGRSASLTDVAIDTAGVTVGICLLLTGHSIIKKKKQKIKT